MPIILDIVGCLKLMGDFYHTPYNNFGHHGWIRDPVIDHSIHSHSHGVTGQHLGNKHCRIEQIYQTKKPSASDTRAAMNVHYGTQHQRASRGEFYPYWYLHLTG